MPKGLDANERARYLYLALGEVSFYDREYEYLMFGEEETMSIYSHKSFENPNIIICTTLSKQYRELLKKTGIKSRLFTDKLGHTFVIYEDEESVEHVADLTRDLKNIQFNCSTSHFARATISNDALRQIDLQLGYISENKSYANDYWPILRNKLSESDLSTKTKFEIVLRSLKEFGNLSKLGESELFSMYEKFVRYCGNNQFKVYFSSKKIMGSPEEYRVQLTADGKQISYLLNRQTCEFEMESEKSIEENFRDAH